MNPIQRRLILSDTSDTTLVQVLALFIVATVGCLLGGVAFGWPAFYFEVLLYATCPAALILLMLVVTVVATLTRRETSGEPFALLYMTNIRPHRVVWGLVLGLMYRLRVYLALMIWLGTVSAFLMSVSLRSYGLSFDNRNPSVWEGILLFAFWLNGAIGTAFMVIANTVSTTLRFRQPALAAILSLLTIAVSVFAGLLVEFVFITAVEGVAEIFWGLVLTALPYIVGWGLTWFTGGDDYADILTISIVTLIGLHLFACGLALLITTQTADLVGVILIAYFIMVLWGLIGRVYRHRPTSYAVRVTLVTWAMILALLVLQTAARNRFAGLLLMMVTANALLIIPYAFGFGAIDRARHWVWRV